MWHTPAPRGPDEDRLRAPVQPMSSLSLPSPRSPLARYALHAGLGALVLVLSHWDRLYMYGDDVNKLSPGRALPLPDYGNYIGSRIVDNYFIGYGFEVFRMLAGPLFGLRHVVDVHSVYSTAVYAVSAIALVGALFAFTRLFVVLRPVHFLVYLLAAQVLALQPTKMMAITGIGAFQVPLALSLWLLYPVVCLVVLGSDPLARWRPTSAAVALAALAYGVAFSVTSVAYFAVGVVTSSALWLLASARGVGLRARVRAWPLWFKTLSVTLPLLVALATFYDVTSGRFSDEAQQEFRTAGYEPLGWLTGLTHLPLRHGLALDALNALVLALTVVAALRAWSRREGGARARISALAVVLGPTFCLYSLFLLRISNLGGKDYFEHPGISAYYSFALCAAVLTGLFRLARANTLIPALVGTFGLALLAVHGGRQLSEVPTRELTKAEVKGLFDSLYTCHAYGENRVPVLLRHGELGWPHGAAEEGWYLDAHRRAFREHVIGYGASVAPDWAPTFYRVRSVQELHRELDRIRAERPLLELDAARSVYFIPGHGFTPEPGALGAPTR